jgi:hypothetical protein
LRSGLVETAAISIGTDPDEHYFNHPLDSYTRWWRWRLLGIFHTVMAGSEEFSAWSDHYFGVWLLGGVHFKGNRIT